VNESCVEFALASVVALEPGTVVTSFAGAESTSAELAEVELELQLTTQLRQKPTVKNLIVFRK
jgi:hypothetical protein